MKLKVGQVRKMIGEALAEAPKVPKMTKAEKRRQDMTAYHQKARAEYDAKNPRLPEWEGLKVGEWLRLNDGTIGQLKKVQQFNNSAGSYTTAYVDTHFGHGIEQRADIILKGARPATSEEVTDAEGRGKKHSEWMSTQIDTSREGT